MRESGYTKHVRDGQVRIRTDLDGKTSSQFPPPSKGGPREAAYRGLSAIQGARSLTQRLFRLSRAYEADAERTSVKVRSLLGINDGTSRTSPSNQS